TARQGPIAHSGARFERRMFLRHLAGLSLTSTVIVTLLEGCAPAPAASPTTPPAGPTVAPTARPTAGSASTPGQTSSATGVSVAAPTSAASPAAAAPSTFQGVALPTYVTLPGPKPDLPGNSQGLDPAYFQFPTELVKSVPTPPGDGSDVSAIGIITQAAP